MLSFANTLFVPEYVDHTRTVESTGYDAMREFSDAFVQRNQSLYAQYSLWWVKDPLRAWSRAWEYDFVYAAVNETARATGRPIRILDAGSGFTFFPFYVADRVAGAEVLCCDFDPRLESLFSSVRNEGGNKPGFRLEDIGKLSFPDDSFDCVVCISVLEHLEQRLAAFREMMRVMRPGGKVVLTMDYSRDDRSDITQPELIAFLGGILGGQAGNPQGDLAAFIRQICASDAPLATHQFLTHRDQLPWKYPVLSAVISAFKKRKMPRLGVKDIGVIGLVCQKVG